MPPTITAIPSIDMLAATSFDLAAIDIPIGLPSHDVRICDQLARAVLAEHASRVFTGVRRDFLEARQFDASEYALTNLRLKAVGQAGVSLQLWNILPKIKEVDCAIRASPSLRGRLREVHPELVFRRLNGNRSVPRKKDVDGLSERLRLLRDAGLADAKLWITRRERRRLTDLLCRTRMSVQPDDVLDACAAAIAASNPKGCLPSGNAEKDDCGLPMQIWF